MSSCGPPHIQVIDLTDESHEAHEDTLDAAAADMGRRPTPNHLHEPIGVNIAYEVIDIMEDVDVEEPEKGTASWSRATAPSPGVMPKPQDVRQTHPLKILEASRKRKLERIAAKRRLEEERRRKEAERRAEEVRQKNIMNGVNFILIDDDSSDEAEDDVDIAQREHEPESVKDQTANEGEKRPTCSKRKSGHSTTEWVFHRLMKESKRRKFHTKRPSSYYVPENPFQSSKDFNYGMTNEDAAELQERMFQEAAARLRAKAPTHNNASEPRAFQQPIRDIHTRFPDHWQWKEPYACLGLPENACITLIKTQYRSLARVYHPDKSKEVNSTRKFQGIARAYHKLTMTDRACR